MATVTSTLTVARAEIGTVGGTRYRGPGSAPWCASFVSWVLATAGVEPRYSSAATGAFVTWAQGAGRWKTSGPRPGDLVLFRFPGAIRTSSTPPVNHIGFVEAVNLDGSLTTIEGNTSMGNNVNGNGVARRSRPTTYVQGYVAMTYDDAPTDPTTPQEPDMPLNQSDLEAIDRVIASQLDARLRTRATDRVPPETAGVLVSQAGKEELDRMIATRMDERFNLIFDKLGITH